MSEKIRVILADDHVVVLQGLRGLLEQEEDLQVVALVQNGMSFSSAWKNPKRMWWCSTWRCPITA